MGFLWWTIASEYLSFGGMSLRWFHEVWFFFFCLPLSVDLVPFFFFPVVRLKISSWCFETQPECHNKIINNFFVTFLKSLPQDLGNKDWHSSGVELRLVLSSRPPPRCKEERAKSLITLQWVNRTYLPLMQKGFYSEQCHTWFSEALNSRLHSLVDQCDYVYATVTANLCSLQLALFLKGGFFNDGITRQSRLPQSGPCALSSMLK